MTSIITRNGDYIKRDLVALSGRTPQAESQFQTRQPYQDGQQEEMAQTLGHGLPSMAMHAHTVQEVSTNNNTFTW
jgi:hypothetical protein